eukprot:31482-Pelagococcus_subviridis.AAC.11
MDWNSLSASPNFPSVVVLGSFQHTSDCRGGVERRQLKLKGVEGGDRNRGVGGETRREKSLRIGDRRSPRERGRMGTSVRRTRLVRRLELRLEDGERRHERGLRRLAHRRVRVPVPPERER